MLTVIVVCVWVGVESSSRLSLSYPKLPLEPRAPEEVFFYSSIRETAFSGGRGVENGDQGQERKESCGHLCLTDLKENPVMSYQPFFSVLNFEIGLRNDISSSFFPLPYGFLVIGVLKHS